MEKRGSLKSICKNLDTGRKENITISLGSAKRKALSRFNYIHHSQYHS